jgi:hypothetical protein
VVKKHGVRLELFGKLGAPLDVWKLPKYWKHKSHPADYLWQNRNRGKRETLNLAKAAVAPIEDAIDNELVTVVNALRAKVLDSSSDCVHDVLYCALDHAHSQIVYGRYQGKHSLEHWEAIRYWWQTLDLDAPANAYQIKHAQELGLKSQRD